MNTNISSPIAYLGPTGAGFGFQMAGVTVYELEHAEALISKLRELVREETHTIMFVDEGFAKSHLEVIQRLNNKPLPAIILLPNPTNPQNIAAQNMQALMVRAIGSDIFEKK